MKVYTNATVKITERNSFDTDKGDHVEYGVVYLKDDDEGVLKISSGKNDFSSAEGEKGMAIINLRDTGGVLKATLIDFKAEESISF